MRYSFSFSPALALLAACALALTLFAACGGGGGSPTDPGTPPAPPPAPKAEPICDGTFCVTPPVPRGPYEDPTDLGRGEYKIEGHAPRSAFAKIVFYDEVGTPVGGDAMRVSAGDFSTTRMWDPPWNYERLQIGFRLEEDGPPPRTVFAQTQVVGWWDTTPDQ